MLKENNDKLCVAIAEKNYYKWFQEGAYLPTSLNEYKKLIRKGYETVEVTTNYKDLFPDYFEIKPPVLLCVLDGKEIWLVGFPSWQ